MGNGSLGVWVVPFGRELRLGSRGDDVIAVKRGLSRAGLLPWGGFVPLLGLKARGAIRSFQAANHLAVDGVYGPATHARLIQKFDSYDAFLYTGRPPVHKPTPTETQRQKIKAAALYFRGIAERVHYTQSSSRMDIVRHKLSIPVSRDVYEDCSSFSTGCYFLAGAPDPNGRGYDGFGYTGTLCVHGQRIDPGRARPGDLAFYGPRPPWGHVAVCVGDGMVVSHGSEGGPYLCPLRYRSDFGEVRSYLP